MKATTSKPSIVSLSRASAASSALGPVPTTTVGRRQAPRLISRCFTASRVARHQQRDQAPAGAPPQAREVGLGQEHQRRIEDRQHRDHHQHVAELLPERPSAGIVPEAPERDHAGDAERQEQHQPGVAVVDPPVIPGRDPRGPAEQVVHGPPGHEAAVDHDQVAGRQQPRLADRAAAVDLQLSFGRRQDVHHIRPKAKSAARRATSPEIRGTL